jgi:hypothetical protein
MTELELCLMVQFCLGIGLAGLLWPEKLMPIFEVMMFPLPASYRGIRANSVIAIVLSVLLFVRLAIGIR